jgi:hypothetical protein
MIYIPIGAKVHVNADDPDWGRIAADGTVVSIHDDGCLVHIPSLGGGADVYCQYNEVKLRD